MSTRLDWRISIPSNIQLQVPAATPTPAPRIIPIQDELRTAVNAGPSDCFSDLIKKISEFFKWLTGLLSSDSPIDSELFRKWDAVVEKDYDLVGVNDSDAWNVRRGKTIADSFARAVSKTGINPVFDHVFVYQKQNAGHVFTNEGAYGRGRYPQRARNGEFNNQKTLFIIGLSEDMSENERQQWLERSIRNTHSAGYQTENAKWRILSRSETSNLNGDRIVPSLLNFLKEQH